MPDNQLKILIATGLYPPDIGGPATYSQLLFTELPQRGFAVEVLSFGTVRQLPKLIRHLAYFFKVLARGRQADIIYAQDPVSVGLPTAVANFFLGKKFLLKIVGDYAWEQGCQRFGVKDNLDDFAVRNHYRWPVQVLKKIQISVARQADKIIVPSEYLKKIVASWGINPGKIKVIYNAFAAPQVLEEREELRRELNLSGRIIVSVGRLVPWKGLATLIEIMPDLLASFPETELLIIGSGPEQERLENLISELRLERQVKLLGQLERYLLLKYVKAADLFVLNTGYEGFSHQLLEVAAVETPIITTRIGGNPELITDGRNGRLVDYDDKLSLRLAVKQLLAQPEQARDLARQAKSKVAEFTVERMINELITELK